MIQEAREKLALEKVIEDLDEDEGVFGFIKKYWYIAVPIGLIGTVGVGYGAYKLLRNY